MRKYDLLYLSSGRFITDDKYIHPTRVIDSYEIIYITAGTVYFREGNSEYVLNTGDIFLASPNILHRGFEHSIGETSFYWLHFAIEGIEVLEVKPGHTPNCINFRFSTLFKQLLHITNTDDYPAYAVIAALELIIGELKYAQTVVELGDTTLANEILEWIRISSQKKITVQDVGKKFGYHPDYISKLIKKSRNKSLKQVINAERIARAKNLILTTDMTMTQIAESLDCENENQFIHFFQYHEKLGPKKFRDLYFRTHLNDR